MSTENGFGASILVQSTALFESLTGKNEYIQSCDTEWLGFADGDVTGEEELRHILDENPFLAEYDVILFGSGIPEGECTYQDLLACLQSVIYAFVFRKKLLEFTGSYNRFIKSNTNYEFLLRLAEKGRMYSVPSSADKKMEFAPASMAYILRRYMKPLKACGMLDFVFMQVMQLASQAGKTEEFNKEMNLLLADERNYERIAMDTSPCLFMVSNDMEWYGVVEGFANALADELVSLGQAVITTNGRYGAYSSIPKEVFLGQGYKAIIGFQSPALQSESFSNMKGKRYQFWLDDPVFSIDFLRRTPKDTTFLCQDANYARFIREHFGVENAVQFPPAGMNRENGTAEKIYDLVFIGSYIYPIQINREDAFVSAFAEYMQAHVDATVEEGVRAIWQKQGTLYDEEVFLQTIEKLGDVCHNLLHGYRHRVVEAILDAGIVMHVFGDSWLKYCGKGRENLVIHPKIMAEESMQIWAQAKIGLNIMNGHKAGMTERVANILLSGACCMSDETDYLREHFHDGEDIVLFRADKPEQMIEKIRYLLQNEDVRERIAKAGQEKALQEHTWSKRAEELLAVINGGMDTDDEV